MKKIQKIGVLALVVVMFVAFSIFYLVRNKTNTDLTESEAISLLKAAYPEFKTYPNDKLPPQSIQTRQAMNGWDVAFVQEGAGRPILEAKRFPATVDKKKTNKQ